ncbi:hypothetical protein HK405_003187 [Cladochytrium tenue]|nr:hypothetical protein HK405_003187 [Cladochytrium tenue]
MASSSSSAGLTGPAFPPAGAPSPSSSAYPTMKPPSSSSIPAARLEQPPPLPGAGGAAPATSQVGRVQRSYAHRIDPPEPSGSGCAYGCCMVICGAVIGCFGTIPCCCCFPNPFKVVEQGSVGLITRFGKYYRSVDPGLWNINVLTEKLKSVDVKVQIEVMPQQLVMTRDNVQVTIDSVLYWEIVDPYTASFLVSDVRRALIERSQTTLRHIFGGRTLQDCIEKRETIAHEIQEIIAEPARTWGVAIEAILIKDMQFSAELQDSLSAAAKQRRVGESKVIAARAEVESARLMREASDILNTPAAMQIRYLETLGLMSKQAGTKVIFVPTGSAASTGSPTAAGGAGIGDSAFVRAALLESVGGAAAKGHE